MLGPSLQLAKNILASNAARLRRPYKLTLALTYRCNLRCRFCRIWERPPLPEMKKAEVEEFFLKQPYFSWVDVTGGEITLRPDLPEIMESIITRSPGLFLLHFPTNAYLTNQVVEIARLIQGFRIPRFIVSVSLDGPREVHDRLKGAAGSWERALATFERLRRELRVETYLGMTLSSENANLAEDTYRAVRARLPWIAREDFHFNLVHASYFYDNQEADLSLPADMERVLESLVSWQRRWWWNPQKFLEHRYLRLAPKYLRTKKCPLSCVALSSSCFIDPAWTVYPCAGYGRPLGNLREVAFDLDTIWRKAEVENIRKEIRRGRCPHCWTPCEAHQTILGNLRHF